MSEGGAAGRAWLARLPAELDAQRRLMSWLIDFCEATPEASELVVGCSVGRGAADALSDIDGAVGVTAEPGEAGAAQVQAVEALLAAALTEPRWPGAVPLVDMLRHRYGPADRFIRRIFAQFADGAQLDLTVMSDAELGQRGARPDFLSLYAEGSPPVSGTRDQAFAVSGEQVREWTFLGWCALIDADKYLRRGSLWEAHHRVNDARHHIWQLWAASTGAMYPWHGMTQVLDNDPHDLPPGIEATVAGLDVTALRQASIASAALLSSVSESAAKLWPAELPQAMAHYVTSVLSGGSRDGRDATP
ncbi:MAG TPA: hypothetical protein VGI58_08960 [Streptosporangiaceae bacterium]|jgi:hypothetical protein